MRENDNIASTIITLERTALDRWGKGDPSGFLEICAPDMMPSLRACHCEDVPVPLGGLG
jgi:hypothetical protein